MSNRRNHRRNEYRRTEHGPRYENGDPGKGCNSTHVAKGRKSWKKLRSRQERRRDKKVIEEEINWIKDMSDGKNL